LAARWDRQSEGKGYQPAIGTKDAYSGMALVINLKSHIKLRIHDYIDADLCSKRCGDTLAKQLQAILLFSPHLIGTKCPHA